MEDLMRLLKKSTQDKNKTNEKRHLALRSGELHLKFNQRTKSTSHKFQIRFPSNIPLLLRFCRLAFLINPNFDVQKYTFSLSIFMKNAHLTNFNQFSNKTNEKRTTYFVLVV